MTIKEFIKRESGNHTGLANLMKRRLENLQADKQRKAFETLYIYEKHMLEGILRTLFALEHITQEEFFDLIDDIENY